MKKSLLLLFVCLFGALGGVKAWTVDDLTAAGWTLATNLDDITNNVYVLLDAGAQETAVVRGATQANRPRYNTLSNPIFNKQEVWAIEKYGDNYAILGIEDNYYFSSGTEGWNDGMINGVDGNKGLFTFNLSGEKYDIRSVAVTGEDNYMGHWNNKGKGVNILDNDDWSQGDGMEDIAVNKAYSNAPGYRLYKMAKRVYLQKYLQQVPNLVAPVDVSYLIFNSKIYQSGAATDKPLGWDNYGDHKTGDNKYTQGTGNTRLQAWRYDSGTITLDFDYYQGISTLPGGKYRIQTIGKGSPARVKSYLYINNSSTSTKLSKELDSSTDYTTFTTDYLAIGDGHNITIGMEADGSHWAGTSKHTAEAFGDDFHLETDPYLSTIATEFSNGVEMTAGLWYHFEVFKPGKHILTATNLSNIIYATGETTALSAAGSNTFSELQTLNASTHYYIRSSSNNTLTITPCISTVAEELPDNGAMTAGEWYYFDVATAGHYDVVAASLGNIVYTTNGDLAEDASVASKFSVKNNNLSATRYYVKSSSAQTTFQWFLTDDKDCTGYIKNPSFDDEISAENWTLTNSGTEGYYVFNRVTEGGVEEYNRTTIKCEQTITNLPSGVYKVTVQGYYRGGDGGYVGEVRNAKLFANDEEVDIMSINDYKGITEQPPTGNWRQINSAYYVPDNTVAANYAINTLNQYNNEVTVAVSDGKLKIGVKKDAVVGNDWTYFDNFTLTYTGPYHEIDVDSETKTQTYEGTFTEDVDLTPTVECPIVDITGASFTGNIDVSFAENPNGLIIATSAQKIELNYLKEEPVKNIISTKDNLSDKVVITDGYPFVAPFDFQAQEARYSRTVGASTNFGTICVPFALTSNEDIQYYTTDQITGGVLKLTEVNNVTAGTPAIFKKKNSGATSISVHTIGTAIEKDAGSQGESVRLVGKFERYVVGDEGGTTGTAANGNYFISSDVFYEGADYIIVKPFRAYLETAGVSQSRLTLQIDDETTAINELKTLDERQGLKDGKYLIGGKIIVVKEGQQFNVNGVINK